MIYTGRYSDRRLRDVSHLCVRTTRGAPRFPLAYTLADQLEEMKPPREAMGMEEESFRATYEQHLDAVGVDKVSARLEEIELAAGDRPAVLLCFCSLAEGGFCHRRMFAWWLHDRGGRVIPELP